MGDVADQVIDGECCQVCLCPVDTPVGCAFTCSECKDPGEKDEFLTDEEKLSLISKKINCKICKKRVKRTGLIDHMRVKHGK